MMFSVLYYTKELESATPWLYVFFLFFVHYRLPVERAQMSLPDTVNKHNLSAECLPTESAHRISVSTDKLFILGFCYFMFNISKLNEAIFLPVLQQWYFFVNCFTLKWVQWKFGLFNIFSLKNESVDQFVSSYQTPLWKGCEIQFILFDMDGCQSMSAYVITK